MTRAQERALERCPLSKDADTITAARNERSRAIFANGYELGVEDSRLTWKDIRLIESIINNMIDKDIQGYLPEDMDEEQYYGEVLDEFYEHKKALEEKK